MFSNTNSQSKVLKEPSISNKEKIPENSSNKFLSRSIQKEIKKPDSSTSSVCISQKEEIQEDQTEDEEEEEKIESESNLSESTKKESEKEISISQKNRKKLKMTQNQQLLFKDFMEIKENKNNKFLSNNCFIFRKFKKLKIGKTLYQLMRNKDKFFKAITQNNLEPGLDLVRKK
jgi:hypothetical protein